MTGSQGGIDKIVICASYRAVSFPGTCTTMAAEQLAGDNYEDFFHSSPPPENLDSVRAAVREFVMHHHGNNRPVVLITVRNFKDLMQVFYTL